MSEDDEELTKAERARIHRRERDAQAQDRELMNDGSAKWFKQVLDRQVKRAEADKKPRHGKG